MTDEQIIKALEWCEHFENNIVLSGRYGEKFTLALQAMQTIRQLFKDYNRLKSKIEKLENIERLADKTIATLTAENESLKEAIKDLRHEMSYMTSPNTIGDRHEMGAW